MLAISAIASVAIATSRSDAEAVVDEDTTA
jgi:hypothetical protein